MSGRHTYKLLHPERKKPNVPLEVIEYDENGNAYCYYKAFWRPWQYFKLYPAHSKGILNREERIKTVPEHLVIPAR